jgi:hypothetical protein
MLNKNRTGIIVGIFFGSLHVLWTLLVAIIPGNLQDFLNWVAQIYSVEPVYVLTPFDSVNSFLLIIISIALGYALGFFFSAVWNLMHGLIPGNASVQNKKRSR